MTNTDTATYSQLIAVAKLEKSPLNARQTTRPDGIAELKASILAHGLMQNLVVTAAEDGKYRVIAGGRRLEAIQSLQAEGNLPEEYAVPCQVVSEAHAREMSLAENTIRLAMHPADQFQAFAELIEAGQTASEVAKRFGIDESLVQKRMKLARVAPELLQVYREDGMTLECLMAFTITDDHRRQLKVFKSLQGWQKDDPSAIRDALTEKMVDGSNKIALFVGLDAYTAAGGVTRKDLFSEEVYLEKPALLNRLAEKKLEEIHGELEREGWGWIEINPERNDTLIYRCSRLQPRLIGAPQELIDLKSRLDDELDDVEKKLDDSTEGSRAESKLLDKQRSIRQQQDELEEKLAAYVGFDESHKALAGCFVSIGQDGTPFIDKGLVRPEHRKQLAELTGDSADGKPSKAKPKGQLSETLRRDLALHRLHVAQVEIAKHPSIALDLLAFQAATSMMADDPAGDGADVLFRHPRLFGESRIETPLASQSLTAIAKCLSVDWLKLKSEAARFAAFRSLPDAAKLDLLAYCTALTLKPKLAPEHADDATAYDAALSLTDAEVAAYWRPTKDNFLSRLNREQLLAISRDVMGNVWAHASTSEKKTILVEQLDRAFTDPEKHGPTPEAVLKLKSWLPAGMSFAIAAAATPAKGRRARKAA